MGINNNPSRYKVKCARCCTFVDSKELNYEAIIHHNAIYLVCLNVKDCRRRQRKK